MSKKKNTPVEPVIEEEQDFVQEEIVMETPAPEAEPVPVPEEVPAPKKKLKTVKGVVVGCTMLNVREQMNLKATVLCKLPVSSKVKVIADEVHDEWYHVFTDAGVEGFCMKKYISINS